MDSRSAKSQTKETEGAESSSVTDFPQSEVTPSISVVSQENQMMMGTERKNTIALAHIGKGGSYIVL